MLAGIATEAILRRKQQCSHHKHHLKQKKIEKNSRDISWLVTRLERNNTFGQSWECIWKLVSQRLWVYSLICCKILLHTPPSNHSQVFSLWFETPFRSSGGLDPRLQSKSLVVRTGALKTALVSIVSWWNPRFIIVCEPSYFPSSPKSNESHQRLFLQWECCGALAWQHENTTSLHPILTAKGLLKVDPVFLLDAIAPCHF